MANMIKIKRGLKENLPILERGELGYATDTNELFIGVELEPTLVSDNVLINDLSDLQNYYTKNEISSMDGLGLVWNSENERFDLDFASGSEALDEANESNVMNPKRTHEAITSRLNSRLVTEQYASETFVNNKINTLPGTGLTLTDGTLDIDEPFDPDGDYSNLRARATTAEDVGLGNVTNESKATMFTDPTFTGTVTGVTATMVGLGNVTDNLQATKTDFDNHTEDSTIHFTQGDISITESQISDLQNYELADTTILKSADIGVTLQGYDENTVIDSNYETFNSSATYENLRAQATTAGDVGLGNVTNESKATMFTDPTFTGTVTGVTASMVGLDNVTNESKATMFANPTFTGTVTGVSATMVGLGNVTNESKATMFANPTFTGTVTGVSATMVGLGNVTNESKATMFTNPTFTETITISGTSPKLTGVPIPVENSDAANKAYVDQIAQGIKSRTQAQVLVTENLPGTYNSAPALHEFTSSSNGSFPSVDGIDSEVLNIEGSRIVLSDQTNSAHNGLYVLKTPGDANKPWVLRRCTECATSEQIPGSYVFVTKGTQYENTGWLFDVENPITFTIGEDDINVIQFSGLGAFTAGTGLSIDGNQFSLADNYGDTKNPYASKTLKTFLAAPNDENGFPTFRTILASDIPTLNQNTTGTSGSVLETRESGSITFWTGTEAQYNAITTKNSNTLYFIQE